MRLNRELVGCLAAAAYAVEDEIEPGVELGTEVVVGVRHDSTHHHDQARVFRHRSDQFVGDQSPGSVLGIVTFASAKPWLTWLAPQ